MKVVQQSETILFLVTLVLCFTGTVSTNHEEDILLLSRRIDGNARKVINLRKNVSSLHKSLHDHVNMSASSESKNSLEELLVRPNNPQVEKLFLRMIKREEELKTQQLKMSRDLNKFKEEMALYMSSRENIKDLAGELQGQAKQQIVLQEQVDQLQGGHQEVNQLQNGLQEQVNQLQNGLQEQQSAFNEAIQRQNGLQKQVNQLKRLVAFAEVCTKKQLKNPSFEEEGGWYHIDGFLIVTEEAQEGTSSAKVSSGGVYQIVFTEPIHKLVVSGWSKNIGGPASIPNRHDYSLHCDVETDTNKDWYNHLAPFTINNSSWHQVSVKINLPQGIAIVRAFCYFLYRNIDQGVAYFDNMSAAVPSDDVTDLSVCIQN